MPLSTYEVFNSSPTFSDTDVAQAIYMESRGSPIFILSIIGDVVHRGGGGVQPTVTFPIGDHVNILYDYKKTGPSKIMKLLTCRCHHLIDILVEISKNDIFLTLLKCLNVSYPSMFINVCINYYAHAPCSEQIAKNPSTY